MEGDEMSTIPLTYALLCACGSITDMREVRGEVCPACASQGQMISLARVLCPSPTLGAVTYILAQHERMDEEEDAGGHEQVFDA